MLDLATLGLEVDSRPVDRASDSLDRFRGAADRAEGSADDLNRTTNTLGVTAARVVRYVAGLAVAYASLAGLSRATEAARDFDAQLAETATLIEGTAEQLQFLEDQASSMAREFGSNATAQMEAFYQAISAGATDLKDAAEIVRQANSIALGGATNVQVGIDALTTAVNAYRSAGLTAADASDALFVGIRAGKTTADELSSALGQIVPISSSVGVSFDEIVAGVAALTTQGQSTAQAVTGLRQVLASVIKPTEDAKKVADALGISFNTQALQTQGLAGFMQDVIEKTGWSQDALARLFGSVEALNAVLAFTGSAGDAFIDILGQMEDKTGSTAEAVEKVSASLSQRLNVQLALFADLSRQLGGVLLAIFVPALEAVTNNIDVVIAVLKSLAVVMVTMAATQLPALTLAFISWAATLTSTVTVMGLVTAAAKAMGVAITLAGGPIGIIVALLAGAAAYFLLFRDNAAEAETGAYDAAAGTTALNQALGVFYQTAAPAAGAAAIDLANDNVQLAESAYQAAEAELAKRRAILEASQAAYDAVQDPEAALLLGEDQVQAVRAYREQLERLREAEEGLNQARRDRNRAASQITGSDFSNTPVIPVVPEVVIPGIDLESLLGDAGGSGSSTEDQFQSRLDALREGLMLERELVDEWYEESRAIAEDRKAQEILGEQGQRELLLAVEEEYQRRLAEIRGAAQQRQLADTANLFGALADVASAGGKKTAKAVAVFQAIEGTMNAYGAAIKALNTPGLTLAGRFAAYASVLAAGLKGVAAIKQAGSAVGGGGGSGATSGVTRPGSETQSGPPPQRLYWEPVEPDALFSGRTINMIFDKLLTENKRRGTVIEIANR